MNPLKAILGLGCAAATVATISTDASKSDKACYLAGTGFILTGAILIASSGDKKATRVIKDAIKKVPKRSV